MPCYASLAISISPTDGDRGRGSALRRADDTIVSVQLGEAVGAAPRSAGHRHYQ